MTKNEFLKELNERLSKLSKSERDEAIEFCVECFADAESEQAALEVLGSPAKFAAQVLAEYSAQSLSEKSLSPYKMATENTQPCLKEAAQEQTKKEFPIYAAPTPESTIPNPNYTSNANSPYTASGYYANNPNSTQSAPPAPNGIYGNPNNSPYTTEQGRKSSLSSIWYVILGIFALPIALPVAIVVFALICVICALCISLIVALFAVVFGLIFASGFVAVNGILHGSGAVAIGCATGLFGLALVLIPLVIMFTIWVVRTVGKLFAKLFNKLKARSEKNENRK